jgi:squalene-hopene/tetraprenyl-beta-curcumene cyclase
MYPSNFRCVAAKIALVVVSLLAPPVSGDEPRPALNLTAARQYLDSRAGWWLDWSSADRGRGTTCVSCHTTLPYALTLPATRKLPGGVPVPEVARRVLAGVRARVEKWNELAAADPRTGDDVLAPIIGGAKRDISLDTECVLNALVLVANEPAGQARLSDSASKSLDIMWGRQQGNGAWRWLELGLRPWEKDGDYFGATLAAVATGMAGAKYPRYTTAEFAPKAAALRGFLKTKLADKPLLHNRALALWAASHWKDLLTDAEKMPLIADLFAVQGQDGGWSMRDLEKSDVQSGSPGWDIVTSYPRGAVSDGYATGLVVLALKRAGVQERDERLRKGVAWLTSHQASDGTWPTVWVNKERDPQGNIGKFNRDAGAAFALLALCEVN